MDPLSPATVNSGTIERRNFLMVCLRFGLTATLFPACLWALVEKHGAATASLIEQAAVSARLELSLEFKQMLLDCFAEASSLPEMPMVDSQADPAIVFDPVPAGMKLPTERTPMRLSSAPSEPADLRPGKIEDLAFLSVRQLAEMIRGRVISASALTEMYLERLKRYDHLLRCIVTLTEERARAQAREADREIAAGKYRGPLHGIPWGAKDLLAVRGYPTTWGADRFATRVIDEDATVVRRLDAAGAVLIAKLSLGTLACESDRWFGGQTLNPWDLRQGASGSSSGSAAATAAGCVAFSLASESMGSIAAPSARCGVTGVRPSFGLVPRSGAMTFSWSADKIGAICRSVEDCAIVLDCIYGPDGQDRCVKDVAFNWDGDAQWKHLRIGYLDEAFQLHGRRGQSRASSEPEINGARRDRPYGRHAEPDVVVTLKRLGAKLIPMSIPRVPFRAMLPIVLAEAATALDFPGTDDDENRTFAGKDIQTFRPECFIPAIEYLRAQQLRLKAIEDMRRVFEQVDVLVAPTESAQLIVTNLTGHPAVFVPAGFRSPEAEEQKTTEPGEGDNDQASTPVGITFIGPLYGEANLLRVAKAYQDFTGHHSRRPPMFAP